MFLEVRGYVGVNVLFAPVLSAGGLVEGKGWSVSVLVELLGEL